MLRLVRLGLHDAAECLIARPLSLVGTIREFSPNKAVTVSYREP